MFQPISKTGKLFKQYLKSGDHFFKVRFQNLLGKYLFDDGIIVKDEWATVLKLHPNDWLSRQMLINGGYENLSLKLSKKLLENGGIFVDVGANFGLYTCTLSLNPEVQVYSIEPNYIILPSLVENIRLNNRTNVTILNAALNDHFGFLGADFPQENNIGAASFRKKSNAPLSILSCPLNYVFESQDLKVVELVKIDIEGNELPVLKGFSFDKYQVKNIILEFDNTSISFEELRSFFTERGFAIYDIDGQLLKDGVNGIPEHNLWLVNTRS